MRTATNGSSRTHGETDGLKADTSISMWTSAEFQPVVSQEPQEEQISSKKTVLLRIQTQERLMKSALSWMNSTNASAVLMVTNWTVITIVSKQTLQNQLNLNFLCAPTMLDGNANKHAGESAVEVDLSTVTELGKSLTNITLHTIASVD